MRPERCSETEAEQGGQTPASLPLHTDQGNVMKYIKCDCGREQAYGRPEHIRIQEAESIGWVMIDHRWVCPVCNPKKDILSYPAFDHKAINPLKGSIVAEKKTTAQKRNAYNIRGFVSQAIFREFIIAQGDEVLKGTLVGQFDRPLLSALSNIATRAIMKEPRLNVVLRKN